MSVWANLRFSWVLLAVSLLATATAAWAQSQPVNDHYLGSLRLNEPGTALERTDTLRDVRDTTNASVQGDIFSPPQGGGPPEVTSCGTSSYGKTIWYDLYPDVDGNVRIRASGFNSVIAVMRFDRSTALPDFGARVCGDASASVVEELLAPVRGGRAYTIQLGGVTDAAGQLEFLFDFLAATPPPPLCSDGSDNDGDGKVGLADPGCANGADNDEADPPDTMAPAAALSGKKTLRAGRSISVGVSCPDEDCITRATGSISLPGLKAARRLKLRAASAQIPKGGTATLRLKVPRQALRVIKRALRSGTKVSAKVTVRVRDAAGNRTLKRRTIRLRR